MGREGVSMVHVNPRVPLLKIFFGGDQTIHEFQLLYQLWQREIDFVAQHYSFINDAIKQLEYKECTLWQPWQ